MSHYKGIKTEFRSADSLLQALQDLGFNATFSKDLRTNALTMPNRFHMGDAKVAIMVGREDLAAQLSEKYASAGMGFEWNERAGVYALIHESMDEYRLKNVNLVGRLTQRYAFHEVCAKAEANGYTIQQDRNTDGSIKLTCIRR